MSNAGVPAATRLRRVFRRAALPARLAASLAILLRCEVLHTASAGAQLSPVHFTPLAPGGGGTTPWDCHPAWFTLLALGLPAALWAGLAWKRAWDEDPNRLRRAGSRELRRLLVRLKRSRGALAAEDLHAWCQAAARAWGVRVATPTAGQVTCAMQTLSVEAGDRSRWLGWWQSAERALYAAGGSTPPGWVQEVCSAAGQVKVPPREIWLPGRIRHWLPQLAVAVSTLSLLGGASLALHDAEAAPPAAATALTPADISTAPDTRTVASLADAQAPAARALHARWDDWTAHYDVAAQQMVLGNWSYAVAHLSAAFVQYPSSALVRDNLRYSLQQAGSMDPTLRRLLYGAWFQRYPALLSPAGWQRLGLSAALLTGGGLCALVLPLYFTGRRRQLRLAGRWSTGVGAGMLVICLMAWNAWGDLHRADIAMLVEGINLSPVPTDLVPEEETSPVAPGTLVRPEREFLDWKQVRIIGVPGVVAGWTRAAAVMPLYR